MRVARGFLPSECHNGPRVSGPLSGNATRVVGVRLVRYRSAMQYGVLQEIICPQNLHSRVIGSTDIIGNFTS